MYILKIVPKRWQVLSSVTDTGQGIKDKRGKDLTEADETKERWQEYTEEPYKKVLNDLGNHNGVVTQLEPDILECEVKWALANTVQAS